MWENLEKRQTCLPAPPLTLSCNQEAEAACPKIKYLHQSTLFFTNNPYFASNIIDQ